MPHPIARLLLALLLFSGVAQATYQGASSYTLLARSSAKPTHPMLTAEQRQWLEGRHELVLGTSAPDYPPFDITSGGRDYQGLTAEYASLIGTALQLPVRVLRWRRSGMVISTCLAAPMATKRPATAWRCRNRMPLTSRCW